MAVHIRLRRMGKKKQPFYRIVAADSRRARDGRFLEVVGTYNPITKPALVNLFEDRISYWLDQGAQPSDTVSSLFTQIGFTEKYLRAKKGEDVSEVTLASAITERPKKTRRMKKASIAVAEAAPAEVAAPEVAAPEAAAPEAAAPQAAAPETAAPEVAPEADSSESDKKETKEED